MRERQFERVSVWHGNERRSAYRIECSRCGGFELFRYHGARHAPPKAAEQRFRGLGWLIGRRAKDDVCPSCLAAPSKPAPRAARPAPVLKLVPKQEATLNTQPQPPAPRAEPPRAMSREEKRIINLKLHEVYVDERVGYVEGWTDSRIAKDLGVPRAWVSEVRDELFGPVHEPEFVRQLLAEQSSAAAALTAARQEVNRLIAATDEAVVKVAACEARQAELDRRIDRLRKEVA
jgi:hypothetical protein